MAMLRGWGMPGMAGKGEAASLSREHLSKGRQDKGPEVTDKEEEDKSSTGEVQHECNQLKAPILPTIEGEKSLLLSGPLPWEGKSKNCRKRFLARATNKKEKNQPEREKIARILGREKRQRARERGGRAKVQTPPARAEIGWGKGKKPSQGKEGEAVPP